jgi:two-component system alkaline phosphatase synthesis response regulator PhoP
MGTSKMGMGSFLLLVEDERNVGSTLTERLRSEGFQVHWATSVREALGTLEQHRFELVLLDVGLPDGSGFDVARVVRQRQPQAALIFLSAQGSPADRIQGLELGAEDYLAKPFHTQELILRIRNALRRVQYIRGEVTPSPLLTAVVGRVRVYFQRCEAVEEESATVIPLSHKETALLKLLVERRGQVVSRDEMLDRAWSEEEYPTPRTVDNFILKLRKIVETHPEHPQCIRSIRGVGYQLRDPHTPPVPNDPNESGKKEEEVYER